MDLVARLKLYMESEGIAISQFADTCSIPRPTMSQILNGRNKKISDELISKIHQAYSDLSVLWLMFGEGDMTVTGDTQFSKPQNASFGGTSERFVPNNKADMTAGVASASGGIFDPEKSDDRNSGNFDEFRINDTPTGSQDDPRNGASRGTASGKRPSDSLIDFDSFNDGLQGSSPATDSPRAEYSTYETSAAASVRQSPADNSGAQTEAEVSALPPRSINLLTPSDKRITNIVVFYSDNSFQSFYPAMK